MCTSTSDRLEVATGQVQSIMHDVCKKFNIPVKRLNPAQWPWYDFAFMPEESASKLHRDVFEGENNTEFVNTIVSPIANVMNQLRSGQCTSEILLYLVLVSLFNINLVESSKEKIFRVQELYMVHT